MAANPGETDPQHVRLADVAGTAVYSEFVLINLARSGLSEETVSEVRRAANSESGHRTAVRLLANQVWELGASVLTAAPDVAEPGVRLASEDDLLSFASTVHPRLGERALRQRVTPVWNGLRYAESTIENARHWEPILGTASDPPFTVHLGSVLRTRDEVRRVASLPLHFALPHDHEAASVTEPSVDLDSLYATLDDLLADGYNKASQVFWNLGKISLDLLARFTNNEFPDRPPLPTLPAKA